MAKIPFRERLERGVILADGAMGTMLHAAQNLPIDTCFDLLNLTDPGAVADIHRHYIESGAEIIETNTFSANIFKLSECDMQDQCADVNRAGVELARRVIRSPCSATTCISPDRWGRWACGWPRLAASRRKKPPPRLRIQVGALIAAGVDVVIFETFTDLAEITEAIKTARALDPTHPDHRADDLHPR